MVKLQKRSEQIRQFILDNVEHHPKDVASLAAKAFEISRQAVNKHVQYLVEQKALLVRGTTRSKHYILQPLEQWDQIYALNHSLEEHVVWQQNIFPRLGRLPENVIDIWHYGFTEMLNNALDHSTGNNVSIYFKKTGTSTEIRIFEMGKAYSRKFSVKWS